jgi:Ni,Fe-hydrogenase III large subunit
MEYESVEEVREILDNLSDYYAVITGSRVSMGVDANIDVWVDSSRTNGREYFDSIEEAEERIKRLYDLEDEDDYSNPLDGF